MIVSKVEGLDVGLGPFSSVVEAEAELLTWGDSLKASSQRFAVEGA